MDIAYRCWADPQLTVVGVAFIDGARAGAAAAAKSYSHAFLPAGSGASLSLSVPGDEAAAAAATSPSSRVVRFAAEPTAPEDR